MLGLGIALRLLRITLRRIHRLLGLYIALRSILLLGRHIISLSGSTGDGSGSGGFHFPSLHIRVPTAVKLTGLQIKGDGDETPLLKLIQCTGAVAPQIGTYFLGILFHGLNDKFCLRPIVS